MLSSSNRLTSPVQFREVVRRGRRRGGQLMIVHLLAPTGATVPGSRAGPRVGFVVSKAVGPAVVRNLVKRRLRHLCRDRLPGLPAGSMLVIRALPAAASASYQELSEELDRCLTKVGATADVAAKVVISG